MINGFDSDLIKNVLDKIQSRDKLLRNYYRNQTDIDRLQKTNNDIMDKIKELDSETLVMAKPKEVN